MSQYECSANPSTATVTIGLADVNIVVPEKFNHVNLYSYGPEFTRGMSLTFVVDSADSARKVGEAFLALANRMQAPAGTVHCRHCDKEVTLCTTGTCDGSVPHCSECGARTGKTAAEHLGG